MHLRIVQALYGICVFGAATICYMSWTVARVASLKSTLYHTPVAFRWVLCIALHYITLYYTTLRYVTLLYIILHYITLRRVPMDARGGGGGGGGSRRGMEPRAPVMSRPSDLSRDSSPSNTSAGSRTTRTPRYKTRPHRLIERIVSLSPLFFLFLSFVDSRDRHLIALPLLQIFRVIVAEQLVLIAGFIAWRSAHPRAQYAYADPSECHYGCDDGGGDVDEEGEGEEEGGVDLMPGERKFGGLWWVP